MNLTYKSEIKKLFKKYNARPEKYLGQHFILSKSALALMVSAAEINSDAQSGRSSDRKRRRKTDTIIEIGPGLGTLTLELATAAAKIIAVEKDPLMIEILKENIAGYKNVKIIQADACQILMSDINNIIDVGHQYKIVANLPYNAATFLIRKWLESKNPPQMMVLMIQKEVARRIVAKPPHSNLLAISVQFYADAKIIGYVPKESFWPKPKVDAAIIKIIPKKATFFRRSHEEQQFFKIVKAGFSQPRKQLVGNLSKKLGIPKENLISAFKNLDISSSSRAENLNLDDWQKIVRILSTRG